MEHNHLTALPGGDMVMTGLRDLRAGVESIEAAVVRIGATNLRAHGLKSHPATPRLPSTRSTPCSLARTATPHTPGTTPLLEDWSASSELCAVTFRRLEAIEPELYRFPAIDPASFRKAVTAIASPLD